MIRTRLACLVAAVELCLFAAAAATSAQQARAEQFGLDLAPPRTVLILCTADGGCVSQNGDQMTCTGIDVNQRAVFVRAIAYPPDYSEYFVLQQFALPGSFISPENLQKAFEARGQGNGNGFGNGNGNGFGNGNGNGLGTGNQQPPTEPPPQQPTNAFGGPLSRSVERDAHPFEFDIPISIKQYSMRMGNENANGVGVGGTPPGQAPPPVCRLELFAAFGNPFGVCCGPCR